MVTIPTAIALQVTARVMVTPLILMVGTATLHIATQAIVTVIRHIVTVIRHTVTHLTDIRLSDPEGMASDTPRCIQTLDATAGRNQSNRSEKVWARVVVRGRQGLGESRCTVRGRHVQPSGRALGLPVRNPQSIRFETRI